MNNFLGGLLNFIGELSPKNAASYKNNISFMNRYMTCLRLGLMRYDFEDLPDGMQNRTVKRYMLHHGSVIFLEKDGIYTDLPGAPTDDFNVHGDPGKANVYGANDFTATVNLAIPGGENSAFLRKGITGTMSKDAKGFIIRENYLCYPFERYCFETALAIADSHRILDVCRKKLKKPYIISAEQSIINTVKSYLNAAENNEEEFISSGVFPADKIKVLPLQQNPENIKTTTDLIEWYWNNFYELCGINSNSNPDKKAQLTTVEINANDDAIRLHAESVIKCIQEDLDFFNEMTGNHVKIVQTVDKVKEEEYNKIEQDLISQKGGQDVQNNSHKDI